MALSLLTQKCLKIAIYVLIAAILPHILRIIVSKQLKMPRYSVKMFSYTSVSAVTFVNTVVILLLKIIHQYTDTSILPQDFTCSHIKNFRRCSPLRLYPKDSAYLLLVLSVGSTKLNILHLIFPPASVSTSSKVMLITRSSSAMYLTRLNIMCQIFCPQEMQKACAGTFFSIRQQNAPRLRMWLWI